MANILICQFFFVKNLSYVSNSLRCGESNASVKGFYGLDPTFSWDEFPSYRFSFWIIILRLYHLSSSLFAFATLFDSIGMFYIWIDYFFPYVYKCSILYATSPGIASLVRRSFLREGPFLFILIVNIKCKPSKTSLATMLKSKPLSHLLQDKKKSFDRYYKKAYKPEKRSYLSDTKNSYKIRLSNYPG